ncbi:hypothetical protein [Lactiplantibacillus plantarum]|uniref:hypothetical protein n=1 Tax=Lactiplantibacillus plantarum TaxID=1590 RepID=UPI001EE8EAEC|nr:hypothetical protein [Lactiplantibacillus plantarum]
MVRVSKLVSGILVASSLLVSSGVIAQADTPAAPNADSTANTTGTTDIQAMFKGNSSPVSPVNPDNSNKPDNRNVKIPNGTRPYRVVTEKTLTRPKGYYQLPQTDEQLLTWFYASFGSVLLILLMVIRWFNKESYC